MKTVDFALVKKTGTYADALAAVGLGRLLYLLSGDHPIVRDEGAFYKVAWSGDGYALDQLNYLAVHDDPGYRYVALNTQDTETLGLPASRLIDYTAERERLKNWRERRATLTKQRGGRRTPEDEELLKDLEPMKGWLLYQNINVLQGFTSYDALHGLIRASDPQDFAIAVRSKLEALAGEQDPARVSTAFAPKVSAVQVFNPATGKGTNRPKPDGPALGSLPSAFVDWFEEWLRYIGVQLSANALTVGDDIKLFVIAPAAMSEEVAEAIHDDFVSLRLPWSSAKIDILGALGLVRVLIEHSQREGTEDWLDFLLDSRPFDVIAGLQTAYFTSLGSARSLTNMAFIGLPGWFTINHADYWYAILEEHERVIKLLDEEHSEDAALLASYRDFLSAGEHGLAPLLAFLSDYAPHLMQARDRMPPRFTTVNLRRLLGQMGADTDKGNLQAILDDEGFKHVAAAIRRATVSEQFHKARTGQQAYEIHYGLFQDLERKARFKDQFVGALAAFVTDYNTENARIAERRGRNTRDGTGEAGGRRRPQVTTDDLEHVMTLIDKHDSELVAMLLVAYGSAREPREAAAAFGETMAEQEVTSDEGEA